MLRGLTARPRTGRICPMKWVVAVIACAALAGCSVEHAPGVCCISAQDCASIGANGEDSRPCDEDQFCDPSNHMCTLDQCMVDADCSEPAPYCSVDKTCVGCRNDADCNVSAPVCDSTASTCRGCADDSECGSEVCEIQAGRCVDPLDVLYVSPTGGGNVCTQMTPCDLATAIAAVTNARHTIKLVKGSYFGTYTLPGQPFDIHGSDSIVTGTVSATPTISLADYTSLKMSRITVQAFQDPENTSAAINCIAQQAYSPGDVTLDQVTVQSAGIALLMRQCDITLARSHVIGGLTGLLVQSPADATVDRTLFEQGIYGGMIDAQGVTVHVTNSVFVSTDTANTNNFVLTAQDDALIDVSFSTIIGAPWTCTTPATCGAVDATGVCLSSSIVMSTMSGTIDTLDATCGVDHSIVYPQTAALNGSNNQLADPMLVDPANGDFHLMPTSPAVDAADPSATDANDFDGTPRPQGAADDIGAYEAVQP